MFHAIYMLLLCWLVYGNTRNAWKSAAGYYEGSSEFCNHPVWFVFCQIGVGCAVFGLVMEIKSWV
jgi:hypothetical protein